MNKKLITTINLDDLDTIDKLNEAKVYIKAFICVELYPILLELYKEDGKIEDDLKSDINLIRSAYKSIIWKIVKFKNEEEKKEIKNS